MINLLAKIFIKNSKNYTDNTVRKQYGILCGAFGIFLNILLFAFKFIFGTIAKSVAMIADAFNNLSDAASSLVSIIGFKLAGKKPDSEHPFGHGRLEYVSGLIISFFILMMGFELVKSSVENVITGKSTIEFSISSIIILIVAILVKFYMFFYNRSVAKKINSVTLDATAKDSLSDTISTFVVLISVICSKFTTWPIDGIAGIIVGIFILKTGYDSAKETIAPLLGTPPSKEFVDEIEKEVLKHKPIVSIHDLIVHDYGPGRKMISLHAEVPGDQDIFYLHEVIDKTEIAISKKFDCSVTIHMDPIDVNNQRLVELKQQLKEAVKEIDKDMMVHDIRIVPGKNNSNLIFDVVKPFSCKLSDKDLKSAISKKIHSNNSDIKCVITVDSPYVG